MKANLTFRYQCPCGYTDTEKETLEPDTVSRWPDESYKKPYTIQQYRLSLDPDISCPGCHRLLQAHVTIEYQVGKVEGSTKHVWRK